MKIRMDFVTNSSSSSFILARNSKLNEKQKEKLLEYVEQNFLGEMLLTPDSSEEKIQEVFEEEWEYEEESVRRSIRNALKKGKCVYSGYVCYGEGEDDYASVLEDIWGIMEEYGEGDFEEIDGDLSY